MAEPSLPRRPHFWLRPGFWRWVVGLLGAGAFLLLLVAASVVVYPPVLEPVREDLQGWLSERLDRPIRFREVSWAWDGGFTARAVDVRIGAKGKGVAADEVRLGLSVWDLMRGDLRLRRLGLLGLELDMERDARGRLFGGGFRVDPERNRLFPFLARFDRVHIRDGTLAWSDRSRRQPVRLVLTDWDVALERANGGHRVDMAADVADGQVSVQGTVNELAGGPRAWQLDVDSRIEGVALRPGLAYLPEPVPADLPGPLSLRAEVAGGWGHPTRIQGHMRLAEGALRWAQGLRRPLPEVAVRTDFGYRGRPGRHRLQLEETRLTVGGMTVTGKGRLRWQAAFAEPRVDAEVSLGEAVSVPALRRLLAVRALPGPAAEWLGRSIAAGRLEEGRAEVRGPLSRFPFGDGEGVFRVTAQVADTDLAYHPDWPAVTDLAGELVVDGRRLTFGVDSGRILGSRIREATATIGDLGDDPPRLRLQGNMGLRLVDGVRFLGQSPLQPEGFLDPAVLAGTAELSLGLDLPLADGAEPEVSGRLRLERAAFRPRPGAPALVGITGKLTFQEGRIRASGLDGRLFGQPVTLDLARDPEAPFQAELTGSFPADALRTALARHGLSHPLGRRLTGELAARVGVVWGREKRHAELQADLEQAALILPEPVFNGIGEPGQLRLRWQPGTVPWAAGRLATTESEWRLVARQPSGEGWGLGLTGGMGRRAPDPEPGLVRIVGDMEELPLGRWVDLLRTAAPEGRSQANGVGLPRLVAAVRAGKVRWHGRDLGGGRLTLHGRAEGAAYGMTAEVEGERASGQVDWTHQPSARDELRVRLERLTLPDPGDWGPFQGASGSAMWARGRKLDLRAQAKRIELGDRALEDTRLKAQLYPDRWLLHHLQSVMGASNVHIEGAWHRLSGRTRVRMELESQDFGDWLRSVGLYPSMNKGHGSFSGTLWWPGRPETFAPGRLSGDLRLRMAEGEIQKLYFLSQALATLNVLDWPRQVARGFRGMVEGGLVYRDLKGRLHISDGVARAEDWVLNSASLRLAMDGTLDLGARTSDLRVRVQPLQTVDQIISAVPVLGYLLGGDSKTVLALDYRIQGPWSNPEVALVSGDEAESPAEALKRRLKEMEWKDLLPWR